MSMWPMRLTSYAPVGLSHVLGHKLQVGATFSIPHGMTSVCKPTCLYKQLGPLTVTFFAPLPSA